MVCCSCTNKTIIESNELREAIPQVWLDAELAQKALDMINASTLSEYEQQRYRLAEAHLMLKRELRLPIESNLDDMAKYVLKSAAKVLLFSDMTKK